MMQQFPVKSDTVQRMKISAKSPEEYIEQLPEDRKQPMVRLRDTIMENLPAGFEETINYGMMDT